MKKCAAASAGVLLSAVVIAPTFAQTQPPRGTEGPDVRKVEPKGTEGPDVRKEEQKKAQ